MEEFLNSSVCTVILFVLAMIGWDRANYWKDKANVSDKVSELLLKKFTQEHEEVGKQKP